MSGHTDAWIHQRLCIKVEGIIQRLYTAAYACRQADWVGGRGGCSWPDLPRCTVWSKGGHKLQQTDTVWYGAGVGVAGVMPSTRRQLRVSVCCSAAADLSSRIKDDMKVGEQIRHQSTVQLFDGKGPRACAADDCADCGQGTSHTRALGHRLLMRCNLHAAAHARPQDGYTATPTAAAAA